jgi:hypothetical protein
MVPCELLAAYPDPVRGAVWERVSGGYSGATLWRGSVGGEPRFALKKWPGHVASNRLAVIHRAQSLVSHLPFVPGLVRTRAGESVVELGGTTFDISVWLPGEPDPQGPMHGPRLEAAVTALVAIHAVWAGVGTAEGVCPAVERRVRLIDDFRAWPGSYGATRLSDALTAADRRLRPWLRPRIPLHLCFTDVHRDHVLFTGNAVTGVIDYGAVRPDHPATDYARLFGEDSALLDAALALAPAVNADLARALAASAPAINLAAWTLRLSRDGERPADPAAVARRMAGWEERLG